MLIGEVNGVKWINPHVAGYIPTFLAQENTDSFKDQIDRHYVSGWNSFNGFTLKFDSGLNRFYLEYPGDPRMLEKARAWRTVGDDGLLEFACLFQSDWVATFQCREVHNGQFEPVGEVEVARID